MSLAALAVFSQCKVLTTINLRRAGWSAVSSMQIGPMSAVMQNRQKTLPSRLPAITLANCENQPVGSFAPSNGTINTKVSTDWNISVGGRIGWLANQGTLLYLLAAYTHADLSARLSNIPWFSFKRTHVSNAVGVRPTDYRRRTLTRSVRLADQGPQILPRALSCLQKTCLTETHFFSHSSVH